MKARTIFSRYTILLLLLLLCGCASPHSRGETGGAPQTQTGQGSENGMANPDDTSAQGSTDAADAGSSYADETREEAQARFDAMTDRIFKEELSSDLLSLHFALRQPEMFGISCEDIRFPELSEESLKEGEEENRQLQEELNSFDPELLTQDQLLTLRMLEDQLDTEALCDGLELYYQPLSPMTGTQADLPVLLSEYQFYDKEDVEDYLVLLSDIDRYYGQLADYEKRRAEAGLGLSDATIDRIVESCKDHLIRPENNFLTETFSTRLDAISALTPEEKSAYERRHLAILKEHFIPAYTKLCEALEALKGQGSNDMGLCYFPEGKRYYEYLAASLTGSGSSVSELKSRISRQMGSDVSSMSVLLQKEPALQEQIENASFTPQEPQAILEHLREEITADFPALENTDFQIKYVPEPLEQTLSPAFYLVPPLDAENSNVIYINRGTDSAQSLYTTLAHEGYPGHLYQSVYFNRNNACPLRRLLQCGGYVEGWGMYSELYSYQFDNGLSDGLKQLLRYNDSSTYALYALLDIHINYDGWDLEKTASFLSEYFGIQDSQVAEEVYQTMIDCPGNYLKYYTGYLEIQTMQNTARKQLGSSFDIKAFHQFVMEMDGASFRVITPYFNAWLLSYGAPQK